MKPFAAVGLVVALAALLGLLLFPMSGNDTDPPECFALLVVPCGLGAEQEHGPGFALAAAAAATLVGIGVAVGRQQRRRR